MMLPIRILVILGLGLPLTVPPAIAQVSQRGSLPGRPAAVPSEPHRTGELDCQNCHLGEHQGMLRMYLGLGGRGTPMIPSHMFQVRVQCVACHVAPKEAAEATSIVGQTFRPSEQACLDCHGEKYRGMLERWVSTLPQMGEIVEKKAAEVRTHLDAADASDPKLARVREFVDDAEFNARFVRLAKGVHNVFYAADLLKLANGWLNEAFAALGQTPAAGDDTLVRGRYCAVLCHEQAGVSQSETVVFGMETIPHVRHVTELGAVCTACHSAEIHKAVTATVAMCSACHHSPQNERCESCHRAQAAFYRGTAETALVSIEPNAMAAVVSCTGCHDWTQTHSREGISRRCLDCHDEGYAAFAEEWTMGLDERLRQVTATLERAESALASADQAAGKVARAEALLQEGREALTLVRGARGVHNPDAADALLAAAEERAKGALAELGRE